MNSLSVCVSLLALFGCAAANSLWTRAFDPDTVERPIEEYREEYRRNVLERRQAPVVCTAAQYAACAPPPDASWELVKEGVENTKCGPVGKIETEPVIWQPDQAKPCCKYHGCLVGDCKVLGAEFENKKGAECKIKDGKVDKDGALDKCKERVKRKTCGCEVWVCENKACAKNVKCKECLTLTNKVDECGCQTEEASCKPVTPGKEVCSSAADCKNCTECDVKQKVLGDKCATKFPKDLDKHVCVPIACKPNEECNACQVPKVVTSKGGCCNQIKCDPAPEPSPEVCKKPNAKGECASACEEVKEKPLTSNPACKKKVKCCVPKKCTPPAPKECAACELKETVTNACGCVEHKCKEIPEIAMCKLPVKYVLSVKTGGEDNTVYAAAAAAGKVSDAEKPLIPWTEAGVTVKITGACTPEQLVDPKAPKKECVVKIAPKELSKNTKKKVVVASKECENIGLVEKVEVIQTDRDIWFVEEVKIDTPNDPKNKPVVVKVNKILGKVEPTHKFWEKLGPWKPTEEVVTNLVEGLKCDAKCQHVKMLNDHECKPMRNGTCEQNECPPVEDCGTCDYDFPTEEDCGCAGKICVPTYDEGKVCPPGTKKVKVVDVAGERPDECSANEDVCIHHRCDEVCPPEPEDVTCDQCNQKVLAEKMIVGNAKASPCLCTLGFCEPREQCMTKEEAEKELDCPACMEAVETGEELPCGCKKWECSPKGLTGCSEECDACSECKQGFSKECEMPMFQCMPKTCPGKQACQIPDEVDGKPKLDECNCEIFKNKPCNNDPVNACEPGKFTVEEGTDACGCGTKIAVPCEQTAPPTCNSTCEVLKEESDGCCKSWTCEKKPCPPAKKECPKCHQITVEEDECKCCKSTCVKTPCPPVKRCPPGEKPTVIMGKGDCPCPILVKCTPEGGTVTTCPKDKKCKKPATPLELCEKCED